MSVNLPTASHIIVVILFWIVFCFNKIKIRNCKLTSTCQLTLQMLFSTVELSEIMALLLPYIGHFLQKGLFALSLFSIISCTSWKIQVIVSNLFMVVFNKCVRLRVKIFTNEQDKGSSSTKIKQIERNWFWSFCPAFWVKNFYSFLYHGYSGRRRIQWFYPI